MNSLSLPLPSTQAYMRDNETLFNSGLFRRPDLYSMPRAQYLTSDSESLHTRNYSPYYFQWKWSHCIWSLYEKVMTVLPGTPVF
jgi:hypothetical protein